mgnify:CR=1 FL=1
MTQAFKRFLGGASIHEAVSWHDGPKKRIRLLYSVQIPGESRREFSKGDVLIVFNEETDVGGYYRITAGHVPNLAITLHYTSKNQFDHEFVSGVQA